MRPICDVAKLHCGPTVRHSYVRYPTFGQADTISHIRLLLAYTSELIKKLPDILTLTSRIAGSLMPHVPRTNEPPPTARICCNLGPDPWDAEYEDTLVYASPHLPL